MKRIITFIPLLLGSVAWATGIDADCAALAARNWSTRGGLLGERIGRSVERTDRHVTDSGAAFYSVRMTGGGVVITSADSEEEPIVAFAGGTNDLAEITSDSPLWALLNRRLAKRKVAARASLLAIAAPKAEQSAASCRWASLTNRTPRVALTSTYIDGTENVVGDLRVPPLTKSKWKQGSGPGGPKCWNYYTPKGYLCGCVATAMAQIMYCHRWPTASIPQNTYKCHVDDEPTYLEMKGGAYDWAAMIDNPTRKNFTLETLETRETIGEAIGRLTYDCGVSVRMNYYNEASAAFDHYSVNQFKNLFGYASATYFDCYNGEKRGYGTEAYLLTNNLAKVMFANFDAGYPVMLGIDGPTGGHEIVGDGYGFNDGLAYVHLNMGFGGGTDYWYLLPDMNGASNSNFSMVDDVLYNIIPGTESNLAVFSGRVVDTSGNGVSNVTVCVKEVSGGKATAVTNVTCSAYGVYGVCFLPKSGASYHAEVTGADGYEDGHSEAVAVAAPTVKTEMMGYEEEIERLVFKGEDIGNSWGNDIVLTPKAGSGGSHSEEPEPEAPALETNRVSVTVSLGFAMTADNNMKVTYDVTTNGVSRTWEDASFAFVSEQNFWRGDGNNAIDGTGAILVKNFGGHWGGYPVPNTNLEAGGTDDGRFWQIDVPFDLRGTYSVTNMLPKAFITNKTGLSDENGQPTRNNKQYDVNVSCLSSAKVEMSTAAEVRTDKLGAAFVNTVVATYVTALSNGFFRIRMDNSSMPGNGAFGGIQGLVFQGEIVTVTESAGGDEPGGDEPGGDEPGGEDPVVPVRPGLYVDVSTGDDANGGHSPTDAFKTIGKALAAVQSGEVIYVAAGTYYENIKLEYGGKTNVRIESLDGPDVTILDAGQVEGSVSCIVDNSSTGTELTIVGLTIQHGHSYYGGGVYGGVFSNCVITACTASYGGGVCDAILYDCRVHGNTASMEGGGIYHSWYPCELYDTYVWDNWVEKGGSTTSGNFGGDTTGIGGDGPVEGAPPSNPPVEPQPTFTPGTNVVVAPLTQAMWNQGRHYNLMCPTTATGGCDGRMWAGCTAVATAIVMKYYEWPREGETFYQTLNSEKSWENDYTAVAQRARFYRPYEWSKMQDVYGNVTSAGASLAVGELIADIGAAMNMNYGAEGSSTLRDNVLDVLEHNFHFDASEMYHVENSNFTPEVEQMIQAQLREGHPIVSAGAAGASGTGHTYVCDGYEQVVTANGTTNFLYHFNFGWGGTSNGWYPLSAVFTAAKPGEEAVERPVQDMFLGVYPQKAPQIHSAPDVTGPEVRLAWSMATCWTNRVTGFRVEDLTPTSVAVNEDLSGCWSVRNTGYGWDIVGSRPSAKIVGGFYSWSPTSWPNMGINANTTNAVAVSADTTITIRYQARKFKDNVKLYLIKSNLDGLSYDESNNYAEFPRLAELPGGDSENQLTDKTVTVDGTVLASAFGNEPAIFALMFSDDNGGGSYAAGTEVFRLVSFVVSGQGQKWDAIESRELGPESRGCTMGNRNAGDHKFVVTALYPNKAAASSVEKTVRSSEPVQPTVALTSASGQSLTFTVANTSGYSFKFETQSNVMRGTGTKNGNTVTYTFVNDVATMGTHWIALTVTDNETGASARYVHITNPPADHPLCAYTERSVEAAVARARREGKLVLLVESGDPDAKKFMAFSGVLASNEVVEAVSQKYVVAETIASVPGLRAVGEAYWRGQPQVGYGNGLSSYLPDIMAYAVVINPETPSVPYPCDTLPGYYMKAENRWKYFNSQYDISNLGYAYYVASATSGLVQFLGQDKFVVTLPPERDPEPSIVDGELVGTIAANGDGEYVVTPVAGTWYVAIQNAGEHTLVIPPSVSVVSGVSRERLKVKAEACDITTAFLLDGNDENGYYLELNENGVVTNGNEKIAVRPELSPVGSDELATTPFAVSEGVSVGVKTIPGLKYTLLRGGSLEALLDPSGATEAASAVADDLRTRLWDENPPDGKAFYRIRVSTP